MSECGVICFVVGSNSLISVVVKEKNCKQNTLCKIVKINISTLYSCKKNYSSRHILPIKLHKIYYWIER